MIADHEHPQYVVDRSRLPVERVARFFPPREQNRYANRTCPSALTELPILQEKLLARRVALMLLRASSKVSNVGLAVEAAAAEAAAAEAVAAETVEATEADIFASQRVIT